MYRSFADRVFGGVCGGIAALLPVNAWVVRLIFLILAVASLGAFAVLYLALWLAVPQQSLTVRLERGVFWTMVIVILTLLVAGVWYARMTGFTQMPDGADLYYPLLVMMLSVVFLLRQIGRSA